MGVYVKTWHGRPAHGFHDRLGRVFATCQYKQPAGGPPPCPPPTRTSQGEAWRLVQTVDWCPGTNHPGTTECGTTLSRSVVQTILVACLRYKSFGGAPARAIRGLRGGQQR